MEISRQSPAILEEKHLVAIEAFAREFYAKLDFAHNESHGQRVVKNALLIQEKMGGEKTLIEAGAWLHQFHDNLPELRIGLAKLQIPERLADKLLEIAQFCRPHKISASASIEARIVFDADALDLIGPLGCVRELLCNFAHRGQSWEETVANCRVVQELFQSKLMTDAARELAAEHIAINRNFWTQYDQEWTR